MTAASNHIGLRPRLLLPAGLLALLLVGCTPNPPAGGAIAPSAVPQETTVQTGDITIRANAMQTSSLGAAVASQYGIPRDDNRVMLLVGLRRGAVAEEVSIAAQINVAVTDLRGQRQAMPMRELRSGELVDYVGTVEVSLPDTLRFDLSIVLPDGRTSTMQFNREFHPQ